MTQETSRSRIVKVLNGQRPADRLPMIEWAMWWNLTTERWQQEGLAKTLNKMGIKEHWGLDLDAQHWFTQMSPDVPKPEHCKGLIENVADYERLLPMLYPRPLLSRDGLSGFDKEYWKKCSERQQRGEISVWITLEGFFWWPRVLLGVEPHLYAFYDQPELLHRINRDQAAYMEYCLEEFCKVCQPDFMTFAEDMSYNHGPMISKACFDEFLAPYYRQVVPMFKQRQIVTMVDTDGDVEPMIPWLEEVGLEGVLPLERMAGVDVNRIRANHPNLKMIGGFDKLVMHLGEAEIRKEFERVLPAMRSGGYIVSVDHQTPPNVSMQDYQLYLKLLREYTTLAVNENPVTIDLVAVHQ
jgi:hypothetical protein